MFLCSTKSFGYNLILDKDKILAQDQSLYQKSRQVTRFTKVLINLDSKIDTMIMIGID